MNPKRVHGLARLWTFGILLLVAASCAKERPLKPVIHDSKRIPKKAFAGTFFYLKTAPEVRFPSKALRGLAPGFYLEQDVLIQFTIKETTMDVVAQDPIFVVGSDRRRNPLLASFPIRNVDILRKQNPDQQDTNEEELTDTRRVWQDREYIEFNDKKDVDALDPFTDKTALARLTGGIQTDPKTGAINFNVDRTLKTKPSCANTTASCPTLNPKPIKRGNTRLSTRIDLATSSPHSFNRIVPTESPSPADAIS